MNICENIHRDIYEQGRLAFKLKIPIDKCPPYRIKEWQTQWQNGWRDEEVFTKTYKTARWIERTFPLAAQYLKDKAKYGP
jgi:hypothetical protein